MDAVWGDVSGSPNYDENKTFKLTERDMRQIEYEREMEESDMEWLNMFPYKEVDE